MREQAVSIPKWGRVGRSGKAEAIRDTIFLASHAKPTGRWMDVGCGNGEMAAFLAPSVSSMVGVDPDPWPSWPQLGRDHSNLTLRTAFFDGVDCPFPAESVDVVVCNQVYEHVSNPEALIGNIAKVLAPGGVCYFAGPNLLWPIEPHVFWPLVHWLPRSTAQRLMKALGSRKFNELDAYSTHFLRLRGWFALHGLEVRNAIGERLCVELRRRGWASMAAVVHSLPPLVFRLLEPLAPGFVFILAKPQRAGMISPAEVSAQRRPQDG
ncbi:MAG: class I SAM-dependent methyltransferase [Arenimonas sp.]|uniref:class I SAM-dependent methyltransferase n=1 Tax=Arenimonas sp. TaxID=1872635 RepID=UPI0025C4C9EA|nr:class I SAM-dependent methyltransferase [Arenimonas sp.]MBW8369340.1 class I SAM-dependent methyltransferase [Arenimonas sp.]